VNPSEAFQRNGVVVLPQVLNSDELALLADGVEHNRANPSRWAHWYTDPTTAVGFWSDYVTWPDVPAYREIGLRSPLPTIAAELMCSSTVRFFHEHVLVKEAGAVEPTPWHHDQPYYCVDGDQSVSFWIALDPVPVKSALRFIVGSHRWGRWFVPRRFVDQAPYADAQERFEILPEFDDEIAALGHQVVSKPVAPGDVVAFHFRTVHSAPGNLGEGQRRAVSFRYVGDDATMATRPWLHSPPFENVVDGAALDDERFPLCQAGDGRVVAQRIT
jgi:ectoine hydroxylase-related dioxygenase (phytanoyl-CoA dioxygenase family)